MLQVLSNQPGPRPNLGSAASRSRSYIVPQRDHVFTREQHMMKEAHLERINRRAPRRSHTTLDYQIPQPPPSKTAQLPVRQHAQPYQPTEETIPGSPPVSPRIPDSGDLVNPLERIVEGLKSERHAAAAAAPPPAAAQHSAANRPPLGAPRRSYSVMDHEPPPRHHQLSERLQLLDLPSDIHYAIFDFLDPIDSTCLGLTNKYLYLIHRRLRGTVPLSARRDGPNELEWAWHLAGAVTKTAPPPTANNAGSSKSATSESESQMQNALAQLRIRGHAYCRKCGVTRCELHKHIQSWMPEGTEYCSVKQKFVEEPASEGAKPYCYMSKPSDPNRCGRHRIAGTKVELK